MTIPWNGMVGGGFPRYGASLLLAVLLLGGCPGMAVTPAMQTIPPQASTGEPAVAKAIPVAFNPDPLMGLDQPQTRRLLGNPVAIEDKTPATLWRYANESCSITLFFFMDMSSQDFRTLFYDVQSNDPLPDADRRYAGQRCFTQLLAQTGESRHE